MLQESSPSEFNMSTIIISKLYNLRFINVYQMENEKKTCLMHRDFWKWFTCCYILLTIIALHLPWDGWWWRWSWRSTPAFGVAVALSKKGSRLRPNSVLIFKFKKLASFSWDQVLMQQNLWFFLLRVGNGEWNEKTKSSLTHSLNQPTLTNWYVFCNVVVVGWWDLRCGCSRVFRNMVGDLITITCWEWEYIFSCRLKTRHIQHD